MFLLFLEFLKLAKLVAPNVEDINTVQAEDTIVLACWFVVITIKNSKKKNASLSSH